MKCERCGSDTTVTKHDINGFTGYLCSDCWKVWNQIHANG